MQPKYEEKTFESYFNSELDRRSNVYFPFGQVQEGSIGADAAAHSQSRWLWRRLGFPFWFRPRFLGVDLRTLADEMERHLQHEIRNIPPIKTNLLLQYKRPEVITNANGSEWSHWKQRYFRYGIYAEQQTLLMRLDSKFGKQALILYASPALNDVNELVSAKIAGTIIEDTNFCAVVKLQGHHRNTYIRAGLHSVACSEPEHLPSLDLLGTLRQVEYSRSDANLETILAFAAAVRDMAAEDAYLGKSYQSSLQPFVELGLERYKLLFSLIEMSVLRELAGTQWLLPVGDE